MSLMRMTVPASDAALSLVAVVPADRHPAATYLAQLAPGSRPTMRAALDTIAGTLTSGHDDASSLDWSALRYQHTAAVRAALAERYAPATANRNLAALRGVLRSAWRLGLVGADDFQRAVDLPPVRGESLPKGRALGAGELRALFDACARDRRPATAARDAALLALLYGAGLRRAEAVAMDVADFNTESGAITVQRGKGRKARIGYLTNGGRQAVLDWLAIRTSLDEPALLLPVDKAGHVVPRRLTPQAVYDVAKRRARQAGIATMSPHDLRRSFVSDLLDAGADVAMAQKLAGHANITTTTKYDRRPEASKRKAAELLHVPYAGAR